MWYRSAIAERVLGSVTTIQRQRVDQLVGNNDEHREMVTQMERVYDEQAEQRTVDGASGNSAPIPTGDELAAEFERFLRDQDDDAAS